MHARPLLPYECELNRSVAASRNASVPFRCSVARFQRDERPKLERKLQENAAPQKIVLFVTRFIGYKQVRE